MITLEEYRPWMYLASAIVAQAVEDYRKAIRAWKRSPTPESAYVIHHHERFFRSQWCDELLQERMTGDDVIRIVRKDMGVQNADI